jgi:hypothetical protein
MQGERFGERFGERLNDRLGMLSTEFFNDFSGLYILPATPECSTRTSPGPI